MPAEQTFPSHIPTIVAIGGGELREGETLPIDREIVRLTGRTGPRALFIPTASNDAEGYCETFRRIYGDGLGCDVDVLRVVRERPTYGEIERKILGADLIYVGGGNTLTMMRRWRHHGVDRALRAAYERGVILSGLSAGAICWFRHGTSDARRFRDPNDLTLIRVTGLGIIPAAVSPHHLTEPHRRQGLIDVMRRTSGVGLALDDLAAIVIRGSDYRIATADPGSRVHKVFIDRGEVHYVPLPADARWRPLAPLLARE